LVLGEATATCFNFGAPTSATEPHAWHSPHRPTQRAEVHPHSVQAYPGFAAFDVVRAMLHNLEDAADKSVRPGSPSAIRETPWWIVSGAL